MRSLLAGMVVAFATSVSSLAVAEMPEVIFFVRHAAPPPLIPFDGLRDDTPLSETGQQRAVTLAKALKSSGITAIFATEAVRTAQTAEPLAKALGITIQTVPRRDWTGLVKRLESMRRQDRPLVVAHWNTLPGIFRTLGYPVDVKLERTAYDEIFIVFPQQNGPPVMAEVRY